MRSFPSYSYLFTFEYDSYSIRFQFECFSLIVYYPVSELFSVFLHDYAEPDSKPNANLILFTTEWNVYNLQRGEEVNLWKSSLRLDFCMITESPEKFWITGDLLWFGFCSLYFMQIPIDLCLFHFIWFVICSNMWSLRYSANILQITAYDFEIIIKPLHDLSVICLWFRWFVSDFIVTPKSVRQQNSIDVSLYQFCCNPINFVIFIDTDWYKLIQIDTDCINCVNFVSICINLYQTLYQFAYQIG